MDNPLSGTPVHIVTDFDVLAIEHKTHKVKLRLSSERVDTIRVSAVTELQEGQDMTRPQPEAGRGPQAQVFLIRLQDARFLHQALDKTLKRLHRP